MSLSSCQRQECRVDLLNGNRACFEKKGIDRATEHQRPSQMKKKWARAIRAVGHSTRSGLSLPLSFDGSHCRRVSPTYWSLSVDQRGSIHHRQSVCAAKSSAIPTGPRPHLGFYRAIAGKVALELQDKGVTCMHASVLCLAGINPAVFEGHNRNSATTQPTTHVYCTLRQWLVNCFVLANCFARCQFGCWVVVSLFSVLACELNPGWGDYGCFHPA